MEERVSSDPSLRISFSQDTVVFDTLFSQQMSATQTIVVYNKNAEAIHLSQIQIASGSLSHFRFNIDGRKPGRDGSVSDVMIRGRDSLYLFIETTPPPISSKELFLQDSILFFYNNHISSLNLVSASRNAHLLRRYEVVGDEIFTDSLPYLIFDYIHVPADASLTLQPGVEFFMHGGANIIVEGKLQSLGSYSNPVNIRPDRYDRVNDVNHTLYADMPNQWGAIYLQNNDAHHVIDHTIIRSATSGIVLVGSHRSVPSLSLSNSVLHNFGSYAVYSHLADIRIENCEISNSGNSLLSILGGDCYVAHSTFANFYNFSHREAPSLVISNATSLYGVSIAQPVNSFVMENSIVYGNLSSEIFIGGSSDDSPLNILFSHSYLKLSPQESSFFFNCFYPLSLREKNGVDTLFVSTSSSSDSYFDFHLDSLSHACKLGNPQVASRYPLDLDSNQRLSSFPDLGAYQRP